VTTAEAAVAVAAPLVLALMSLRAAPGLRHRDRLPMQWSRNGRVRWTAPRRVALAMLPALAAAMMAVLLLAPARPNDPPRLAVLAGVAALMVMVHAYWLRRAGRDDRPGDDGRG